MASGHGHVGDVGAPYMIGSSDRQGPQQVGIFAVTVVRNAGARLAPNRFVGDLLVDGRLNISDITWILRQLRIDLIDMTKGRAFNQDLSLLLLPHSDRTSP